ncbi:hypothetical protein PLICRDRAFT_52789 [Plicaturopsis crispa FD-325 SS-3]|nr:hypothetical protein PLICRDRAFT_52789 [Plicaturopsis crispa FD-325 SS-3]
MASNDIVDPAAVEFDPWQEFDEEIERVLDTVRTLRTQCNAFAPINASLPAEIFFEVFTYAKRH